jgi:hypothetical protein
MEEAKRLPKSKMADRQYRDGLMLVLLSLWNIGLGVLEIGEAVPDQSTDIKLSTRTDAANWRWTL